MSKPSSRASLSASLDILANECRPRRLIQEDPGVKGPLWFGRNPESPWHIPLNIVRLIIVIPLAPIYFLFPKYLKQALKQLLKGVVWSIEWFHVPDAILLEPPGGEKGMNQGHSGGQYAVTGNKPRWLLEVHFQGKRISSQRQVPYDGGHPDESTLPPEALALQESIQKAGYTAISYPMKSAEVLFREAKRRLDRESEEKKKPGREFSLLNRKRISQTVLDCYAAARARMPGAEDGVEYIWLDEFCLADARLSEEIHEAEIDRQRDLEVGLLADIFRSAKRVVVFCHEPKCDHTNVKCLWGKRLFTIGEILSTPEVLQMTRSTGPNGKLVASITVLPGPEFRWRMQARAAQEKMWHLYNVMQHSANSGSIAGQSAIHSLVVEAVRRDEAEGYHSHNMLGKALNGLLPRRSRLEDLEGIDGWADLAWLLELNQGFYNAALLAAVCKVADPRVKGYRWWGKPIAPREGHERLEPLATAIPVKFRNETTNTIEPVLSIIGPKSIKLSRMLRRDSAALYHNQDMRGLMLFVMGLMVASLFTALGLLFSGWFLASFLISYLSLVFLGIIELLVGTIYVKKDGWIAFEDHSFPGGNPFPFLQSSDPDYTKSAEWGNRQLSPTWDQPDPQGKSKPGESPRLYPITLVDLKTGVYARASVIGRPNNMVALAVHGSGITCMLLQRNKKAREATVSAKVGMVNVPPFVLAQAQNSSTVYVGGGALCAEPTNPSSSLPSSSMPPTKEKPTGSISPPTSHLSHVAFANSRTHNKPSTIFPISPISNSTPHITYPNAVMRGIPSGAAVPVNLRSKDVRKQADLGGFNPYRGSAV